LENSKCEDIEKIWNEELIFLNGDKNESNEIPTWRLILTYIAMDIRYNNRFSTENEWVKFLIEETSKKEKTIYSAINKMKKTRILLEIKGNKYLIPDFLTAYHLGIAECLIMRRALISDPVERATFEYFRDRKNQIIKDFIQRNSGSEK